MIEFGTPQVVVLLVAAQRLVELLVAQRNTRRLLQEGGREVGARHYPLFVLLHGGWLLAMFLFIPADAPLHLALLAVFVVLQLLRVWIVLSLGRYWTTRIITVPGAPLVRRGPYRFMRHPNYRVVFWEVAVLPLVFGAWQISAIFSVLNAVLLWHRIRIEDAALASRR
jgi:methyltransferase